MTIRELHWNASASCDFDVLVLGGGVNGAAIFDELSRRGFRVLLVDREDFASGTSQASSMLIWGGLLYLRNLELSAVWKLSGARDDMIRDFPDAVKRVSFRYVPSRTHGRNPLLLQIALHLYWWLGRRHGEAPRREAIYPEQAFVREEDHRDSFRYGEAGLTFSDARFTLDWILAYGPPRSAALNYVEINELAWRGAKDGWRLSLRDRLTERQLETRARVIVNAAGPWADEVNREAGIETPWEHFTSAGVHLGLPRRDAHETPLVFDQGDHDDYLLLLPFGPVALWGPTDTQRPVDERAFDVTPEDVRFLLDRARQHFRDPPRVEDIVSLRCGMRALVVPRGFSGDCYPLDLSRRSEVVRDAERPWISVYGGKITGCCLLARQVSEAVEARVGPSQPAGEVHAERVEPAKVAFPGLDQPIISPRWSAEYEFCCTLDDYARRRTNLSQWIPRRGLGRSDEFAGDLRGLARALHATQEAGDRDYHDYVEQVAKQHDAVLSQARSLIE